MYQYSRCFRLPGHICKAWSSQSLDVIWTTPIDVLGVLPIIVIFGPQALSTAIPLLQEYFLYMSTPSVCFLGVVPQVIYHFCGSTPKLDKMLHWD